MTHRYTAQEMLFFADSNDAGIEQYLDKVRDMLRQAAADLAARPTREELAKMLHSVLTGDRWISLGEITKYPEDSRSYWRDMAANLIAAGVQVRDE